MAIPPIIAFILLWLMAMTAHAQCTSTLKTNLPTYTAQIELPYSPTVVLTALSDINQLPQWLLFANQAKLINANKDHANIYIAFNNLVGLGAHDVMLNTTLVPSTNNRLTLCMTSTESPLIANIKRINYLGIQWTLDKLSPQKTRLTLQMSVDLGVSVPIFFSGLAQSFPQKSLHNLKTHINNTPAYSQPIAKMAQLDTYGFYDKWADWLKEAL